MLKEVFMAVVKGILTSLTADFFFKKDKKERDEKIDKATDGLVEKVQDSNSTEKDKKDAFKDYINNLPK